MSRLHSNVSPSCCRTLPEILQDFDTLGSEPSLLTELLESEGVIGNVRIALDLCCGKGAVAIELARRFGIRIDGIDAMEAFIESARTAATVAGIDHLCRFTTDDLCETVARPPGYDLVIFSSVGPILGGITSTVAHLVRPLRGLGWILIEDSILLPGSARQAGLRIPRAARGNASAHRGGGRRDRQPAPVRRRAATTTARGRQPKHRSPGSGPGRASAGARRSGPWLPAAATGGMCLPGAMDTGRHLATPCAGRASRSAPSRRDVASPAGHLR